MPDPTGGAINRGPEVTFGCGAFLPGRGPFNFDDFTDVTEGSVDSPDVTGIPPGTTIDDNEIDFPPRDPQEGTGPFGGGVITPGSQFKVGCTVPQASNFDETADGCDENDPLNFDCCEFYDGCPDPDALNWLPAAWGCGGTYEDQGNTDCCYYDEPPSLEDPLINLGNGNITPGFGNNYGEELFIDMTVYTGSQNPTGDLYSRFTPIFWDLGGAHPQQGGSANAAFLGYAPGVTASPPFFNRWAPTPNGSENISFNIGNGKMNLRNFTADFGPGVEWNGNLCEGITAGQCNDNITEVQFLFDWFNPNTGNDGLFYLTVNVTWVQTLAAGAGNGSTGSTLSIPQIIKRVGSALLPKKRTEVSRDTIISKAVAENRLDLNDPMITARITSDNPTGIMDADIAYEVDPAKTKMISNDTGSSDLFGPRIDENISYIVKNNEFVKDWDSTKPRGVTERAILRSLTPEARWYLSRIKNYDGTPINTSQRFAMIGSRILDGTLGNINVELLRKFAEASDSLEDFEIIRSNSERINEVAALAYIERNYKSLDPAQSEGTGRLILPNWKVFATDVDKHIEIRLSNGTLQKFYVKDDNMLVDRSNIKVQDGDFVEVKVGGVLKRFFCKSEIDHAFLMPEKVKMKAINLLGGDSARTLSVSAVCGGEINGGWQLQRGLQEIINGKETVCSYLIG